MSDRITIDHIHNNITIHVNSKDLSTMSDHEILQWIRSFTRHIDNIKLQKGIPGENKSIHYLDQLDALKTYGKFGC